MPKAKIKDIVAAGPKAVAEKKLEVKDKYFTGEIRAGRDLFDGLAGGSDVGHFWDADPDTKQRTQIHLMLHKKCNPYAVSTIVDFEIEPKLKQAGLDNKFFVSEVSCRDNGRYLAFTPCWGAQITEDDVRKLKKVCAEISPVIKANIDKFDQGQQDSRQIKVANCR